MHREALQFVLVGALLGAVLALALAQFFRGTVRSFKAKKRASRALRGEKNAETLLATDGYRVLDRQVTRIFNVDVGDVTHAIELRADLLVTRGERTFVAEVKTGDHAPSIETANTRRQLLEYRVAFDVDGVLLVDVEDDSVEEVVFPLPTLTRVVANDTHWKTLAWIAVAVIVTIAGVRLVVGARYSRDDSRAQLR